MTTCLFGGFPVSLDGTPIELHIRGELEAMTVTCTSGKATYAEDHIINHLTELNNFNWWNKEGRIKYGRKKSKRT